MGKFVSELDNCISSCKRKEYYCIELEADKMARCEASIVADNKKRLYLADRTFDIVMVDIKIDSVYVELKLSAHIESTKEALGRIVDILKISFSNIAKQSKIDFREIKRLFKKILIK